MVLSIAGFDPSSGAGILADTQTFHNFGQIPFGVLSANTLQTEDSFERVDWVEPDFMLSQISLLLERYPIHYIKIGLIKDFSTLLQIAKCVKQTASRSPNKKEIFLLWDPILSASAGFSFHDLKSENPQDLNQDLVEALTFIDFVTPNVDEFKVLEKFLKGSSYIIKSFESDEKTITDLLVIQGILQGESPQKIQKKLLPEPKNGNSTFQKHGSGCIFSSALLSNLALGKDLFTSCKVAGEYVFSAMQSSETLLSKHFLIRDFKLSEKSS
ncbi:MAG: hypothetical protein C4K58_02720 [Flavobacteriaceae bacterium]|nr:MAG: hypothetical protein C4K58_02720 [Flavobacteriaceae bacterium]